MPCLNWHGDFIVHFSINISSHPQLMRSMVSSTRKISAPFSSSSFPAVMATPMTAPSSAQGAGETGAADRLAARRRFSLFFTGQAPLVICAARVRSAPPAGARKNTGILPSLTGASIHHAVCRQVFFTICSEQILTYCLICFIILVKNNFY